MATTNKMKGTKIFLLLLMAIHGSLLPAQTTYYDASQFPVIGKISDSTETRYERLPASIKALCRPPVWALGKNTSGLAVRFRTNSTSISAKWELLEDVSMNHMTDAGIKGLDLYAWYNGHWQFVNTGRPTGKSNDAVIIANMLPEQREYMLFLPLYDGITSLSIGIDSLSLITVPDLPYPLTEKPIICYGTSITQGGCASRPGMSYTNILTRKLNTEIINLGFSGNGQLDYPIAGIMGKRQDASLFVLDFIPNVNAAQIRERTASFVRIIREENPETPILFVETVIFPHTLFDRTMYEDIAEKNRLLRKEYERLKHEGDEQLYYLSSDNLIGNDGEATVDGIHFTDLGFDRFALALEQKIKSLIDQGGSAKAKRGIKFSDKTKAELESRIKEMDGKKDSAAKPRLLISYLSL